MISFGSAVLMHIDHGDVTLTGRGVALLVFGFVLLAGILACGIVSAFRR